MTAFHTQVWLPTNWAWGIELRFPDLEASALSCWATLTFSKLKCKLNICLGFTRYPSPWLLLIHPSTKFLCFFISLLHKFYLIFGISYTVAVSLTKEGIVYSVCLSASLNSAVSNSVTDTVVACKAMFIWRKLETYMTKLPRRFYNFNCPYAFKFLMMKCFSFIMLLLNKDNLNVRQNVRASTQDKQLFFALL